MARITLDGHRVELLHMGAYLLFFSADELGASAETALERLRVFLRGDGPI